MLTDPRELAQVRELASTIARQWIDRDGVNVIIDVATSSCALAVHGVVKEKTAEGDATRVVVEVWCENQDGDMTAVGTASGLIR